MGRHAWMTRPGPRLMILQSSLFKQDVERWGIFQASLKFECH